MNTSQFLVWMLVLLMPLLQAKPGEFGDEWRRKWRVLDESLDEMTKAFQDLGKPLGNSIQVLMKEKFGDFRNAL